MVCKASHPPRYGGQRALRHYISGAPNRTCSEPLDDSVELFLEGLRFDQRVKLEELATTGK